MHDQGALRGKRIRKARGPLTLDALAKRMVTTRQVLIGWEQGKVKPRQGGLERLAEATGDNTVVADVLNLDRGNTDDDEEPSMPEDLYERVRQAHRRYEHARREYLEYLARTA